MQITVLQTSNRLRTAQSAELSILES